MHKLQQYWNTNYMQFVRFTLFTNVLKVAKPLKLSLLAGKLIDDLKEWKWTWMNNIDDQSCNYPNRCQSSAHKISSRSVIFSSRTSSSILRSLAGEYEWDHSPRALGIVSKSIIGGVSSPHRRSANSQSHSASTSWPPAEPTTSSTEDANTPYHNFAPQPSFRSLCVRLPALCELTLFSNYASAAVETLLPSAVLEEHLPFYTPVEEPLTLRAPRVGIPKTETSAATAAAAAAAVSGWWLLSRRIVCEVGAPVTVQHCNFNGHVCDEDGQMVERDNGEEEWRGWQWGMNAMAGLGADGMIERPR